VPLITINWVTYNADLVLVFTGIPVPTLKYIRNVVRRLGLHLVLSVNPY